MMSSGKLDCHSLELHWLVAQVALAFIACLIPSNVNAQGSHERSLEEIIASRPYAPQVEISGTVSDTNGQPVAATVTARFWETLHTFRCNEKGEFKFSAPANEVRGMLLIAASKDETLMTSQQVPWKVDGSSAAFDVKLEPAKSFDVEVKDQQGNPVANCNVGCYNGHQPFSFDKTDQNGRVTLVVPGNLDVDYLFAFSPTVGADYRSYVVQNDFRDDKRAVKPDQPTGTVSLQLAKTRTIRITLKDQDGNPVVGERVYPWLLKKLDQSGSLNMSGSSELFSSYTDENGVATFSWIPDWSQFLTFWPNASAYTHERLDIDRESKQQDFEIVLRKLIPISGVATLKNGQPAANLPLRFQGRGLRKGKSTGESCLAAVYTNKDGAFDINVAPYQAYLGVCEDKKLKFRQPVSFIVEEKYNGENLKLTVAPGTRVFGKVTVANSEKPLPDHGFSVAQFAENEVPIEGGEADATYLARPTTSSWTTTDKDGNFEMFVGAGTFWTRGSNSSDTINFTVDDEEELELNLELDVPQFATLAGKVTDSEGNTIEDAEITGIYAAERSRSFQFQATTDSEGKFEVNREMLNVVVRFQTRDGKLSRVVTLEPDENNVEIELLPTVTVLGTLVDSEGDPIAEKRIKFGHNVRMGNQNSAFTSAFGKTVTTDKEGNFTLEPLAVETEYVVSVVTKRENGMDMGWKRLTQIVAEPDETNIDLGEVTYEKSVPYVPPTLEERIAKAFGVEGKPVARFDNAIKRAKLTKQLILVVFADASDPLVSQYSQLKYDDRETREILFGFTPMSINLADGKFDDAKILADKLDIQLGDTLEPVLAVVDTEGSKVSSVKLRDFIDSEDENRLSKTRLNRFFTKHTPKPLDGQKVLDEALAEAKREGKKVICQETATWCGPCLKLSEYLDRTREIWSKDYIWIKMDHRWTDARKIMAELRDGAEGGIPWTAILDEDGKVLVTSNKPGSGENFGFPSSKRGRLHFKFMLMKTRDQLTDEEIDGLVDLLKPQSKPKDKS